MHLLSSMNGSSWDIFINHALCIIIDSPLLPNGYIRRYLSLSFLVIRHSILLTFIFSVLTTIIIINRSILSLQCVLSGDISSSVMATSTVQHVAKPSSDQLLRKFADIKPDKPRCRKRTRAVRNDPHRYSGVVLPERRSLLPASNPRTGILRRLKTGKPELRYQMRNRFLLGFVKKV